MDRAGAQVGSDNVAAGYPQLVERAVAFVAECGGQVDEDRLIAHVFGNTSSPTLWKTLLRTILDKHPALARRPDGSWTNGTSTAASSTLSDYVVVDVETTGLKPSQQRIIEIAVIRVSNRDEPLAWTSLINPGRSIPAYVAGMTGIKDTDVANAPAFRSVAPTVVDLVGDLPIVAHNAEFDLAFINAELSRCGYPRLVNPLIDTLALAQSLAPAARRLGLQEVARSLGISGGKAHRAHADARLTLDVFHELSRRADAGGATLDNLLKVSAARPTRPRAHTPSGRGRSVLDRSHLADIPNAPGVYVMRDVGECVLYVGKSKDLRKRVASYYSQPLGYTRKMDGLLESLARIDIEVVGTELEALILESQLIRRYRPRFNTVQRNVEQYVYIRVDVANPWPSVTASKDRANDGAVYFGPFHSAGGVREAVDLVNDILPLRTCKRSFSNQRSYGSPCIELSLKRCAGPCMGVADRDEYKGYVRDVLDFLAGDTGKMIDHLHRKLDDTVRSLDFERAARLRDQIGRVERVVLEEVRLNSAARFGHALLVLPSAAPASREIWYLLKGQRWAALTVGSDSSVVELAQRLRPMFDRARSAEPALVRTHHSVDEMSIIARWMRRSPDHEALIAVGDPPDFERLAATLMAVDLAVPFGEAREAGGETDESAPEEFARVRFESDWSPGGVA